MLQYFPPAQHTKLQGHFIVLYINVQVYASVSASFRQKCTSTNSDTEYQHIKVKQLQKFTNILYPKYLCLLILRSSDIFFL